MVNRMKRILPASICCALLLVLTAPVDAQASTVPVRNGYYGDVTFAPNIVGFRVRDRVIRKVATTVDITCHNSDTGEDYDVGFISKTNRTVRVRSNGNAHLTWEAEDAGRTGTVTLNVTFRRGRAALASIAVDVAGGYETCNAYWPFRLQRGP